MDTMQNLRRTCYCGEVTEAGKTVVVGGFVQKSPESRQLDFHRPARQNWHCTASVQR